MDKERKMKILLSVLAVIMIVVWGPVFTGGSKKDKAVKAGKAAKVYGSGDELITLARKNERKMATSWYTGWGRNPFVPAETARASVLEGIMWDAVHPKAIINGEVLGVGDETPSGRIIDIQPDSVTMQNGKDSRTYRLGP